MRRELRDLYSSPSIFRIMKSRRMRWAGHVARMGEKRIHKINTCQKLDFHVPLVSLCKDKKGVYYSCITLFNSLPLNIKQVHMTLINANIN
jgi:hypothetical protein